MAEDRSTRDIIDGLLKEVAKQKHPRIITLNASGTAGCVLDLIRVVDDLDKRLRVIETSQ
jgi:hypothetical protein